MPTPKKLDPISIRLDADLKSALQILATADDRSLSSYITRVLRDHVAKVGAPDKSRRR